MITLRQLSEVVEEVNEAEKLFKTMRDFHRTFKHHRAKVSVHPYDDPHATGSGHSRTDGGMERFRSYALKGDKKKEVIEFLTKRGFKHGDLRHWDGIEE